MRDINRRQELYLLVDNEGFCHETFGALVKALLLIAREGVGGGGAGNHTLSTAQCAKASCTRWW